MFFQGLNHAGCDPFDGMNFVTTGENVPGFVSDEADDLIIPCRFTETFEDFGILPACIIVNGDGFEEILDQFDQGRVTEDFGPKDLAPTSARNFLKEQKDGFSRGLGGSEGFLEIARPFHGAQFNRLPGSCLTADEEAKEGEKNFHRGIPSE